MSDRGVSPGVGFVAWILRSAKTPQHAPICWRLHPDGRLHARGTEGQVSQPHARGTLHGIGDRRRGWTLASLAGPQEGQTGAVDDMNVDRSGSGVKAENGIGAPIRAGDVLPVKPNLFVEPPA